ACWFFNALLYHWHIQFTRNYCYIWSIQKSPTYPSNYYLNFIRGFYKVSTISISHLATRCDGSTNPDKCLFTFSNNGESWNLYCRPFHTSLWGRSALVLAS